MKISTLYKIARQVSGITGRTPRLTVNEMTRRLHEVADNCRTKREAAEAIASRIFNHECNGDYPATDARILNIR
jgi:hypothetical protein